MKKITLFVLLACVRLFAFAEEASSLEGFEFAEKEVSEILYSVSLFKGIPIFADDTVSGKMTFRSAASNFDEAFDAFLTANSLYVQKSPSAWTVSRLRFLQEDKDAVFLDARMVKAPVLIEKVSMFFKEEITYEGILDAPISLHTSGSSAFDFASAIARALGSEYSASALDGHVHIERKEKGFSFENDFSQNKIEVFAEEVFGEDYVLYTVDVTEAPVLQVLEKLFSISQKKFIFACGAENTLRRVFISGKRFEETLTLLCELSGLCYKEEHGAFCIQDAKFPCFTVKLSFITTAEFLLHLPPGISPNQIAETSSASTFFFTGSEEQHKALMAYLEVMDSPAKTLRYDLLVMQFQSAKDESWAHSLSARKLSLGDKPNVSATLGSVLDLNFDVIGAFGLQFASSLQSAVNESRARVFADTTLCGISGEPISFKNTNTYRYRDNNIDPETGKPLYTGITRELSSGLEINVIGSVSGSGMISTKVTASVSRQGADLSSSTGNPPPTSEKSVTTEVLGKSGEIITLTGLIQNETSFVEQRVPLLSRIPLLGNLFRSKKQTEEKTEMVIYLVPHLANTEERLLEEKLEDDAQFFTRVIAHFVLENE